jgi:hypothetical protein
MTIRRTLIVAGAAAAMALALTATFRAGIVKPDSDWSHDIKLATFCIEGHVFVVAISDVGKGGGTAIAQIQHDADGRVVPMKCPEAESARPKENKAGSK